MQAKLPQILFLSGCFLLFATLLSGWYVFPAIFKSQIEKQSVLENGTDLWKNWIAEKDIYFKIYVFNVSNPEKIESGGEPRIEEIGPYIYNKILSRNVDAITENDTVIYSDIFTFEFNEELSHGKESDEIIVLDLPFLAVSQEVSTLPLYMRYLASTYLTKFKPKVFVRRTVAEHLFKGTYNRMMYELQLLSRKNVLPDSIFGLLREANATSNGEMVINSGKTDISQLGETISWKGKEELDFWDGHFCNMLNGTDSTLFPPFVSKENILYLFSYELCRSVPLTYSEEVDVKGVLGYRFAPVPRAMANPKDNPDNRCFCLEKDIDKCLDTGFLSLKSCYSGAPIVISAPHFLHGEIAYSKKFDLRPEIQLHQGHIIVEPHSGTTLQNAKRIQLNAEVKNLPTMEKFKKIQNMIFPLIWAQEDFTINEEMAVDIRSRVTTPLKVLHVIRWVGMCISSLLILIGVIIFLLRERKKIVFV